jgi:hypothetical protein
VVVVVVAAVDEVVVGRTFGFYMMENI